MSAGIPVFFFFFFVCVLCTESPVSVFVFDIFLRFILFYQYNKHMDLCDMNTALSESNNFMFSFSGRAVNQSRCCLICCLVIWSEEAHTHFILIYIQWN